MKPVLYLAGIAAILTSACTAFTPPETAQVMNDYCGSEPTEMPAARTFKLAEDGPSGMLSPRQALERAKQAAEETLLRFTRATLRFTCHTFPTAGPLLPEPEPDPEPPVPVWEVNMRGSFEDEYGCTGDWRIILDARTGHAYQSSTSGLKRGADCSAAG